MQGVESVAYILFLPFLLAENITGQIAASLRLPPPPKIFTERFGQEAALPLAPGGPFGSISPSLANDEVEEIERDDHGFIKSRRIRRHIRAE